MTISIIAVQNSWWKMDNLLNLYDLSCTDCSNEPLGRIPLARILDTLDRDYGRNDLEACERHLRYWIDECVALKDIRSELSLSNELLGLCRRLNNAALADAVLERVAYLVGILRLEKTVSGATILVNMATTCKHFGASEKALTLYQRAEDAYEGLLPAVSYEYAALYNNKATVFLELERYEEAWNLLMKALEILECCPKEKIDQAISYGILAEIAAKRKKNDEDAEAYLAKAWEIICSPDVEHNGKYAFVCAKSAEVFYAFGKYEEALALDEVAREIYEGA